MILTNFIAGEPRMDFMLRTGWKLVGYGEWFTDSDGSNKDRYVIMRDPDYCTNRRFLESVLNMPFETNNK